MSNSELIKVLRYCGKGTGCHECPIYREPSQMCFRIMTAAADAIQTLCDELATYHSKSVTDEKRIDGLQKLVDINTERCEALRKQLRESHESYEKHINELEAQLTKGEQNE